MRPIQTRLTRLPEVLQALGVKRTALYEMQHRGVLTRPVSLTGGRAVGWPVHEIEAIIAARLAGKSNDEVRALVEQLHNARAALGAA